MEGLFLLKEVLQKVDYMCKTNLNEAYFQFPSTHNLKNLWGFNGGVNYSSFYAYALVYVW